MALYDYPDASTAAVSPMSEAALASQLTRIGVRTRYSHGRWWRRMKPGFYTPLHWLARMSPEQARRPGRSWGFVAGLEDRHSSHANAVIPVHALADLATFSLDGLPRFTRRALRRVDDRGIRIVHVTDERILADQGYAVMRHWRAQKGLRQLPQERFTADVEGWLGDEAWVVVAAMDGDRLLGYASAWAVEEAAYLHTYAFLEETKRDKLGLSAVLNVAMVTAMKRTGTIRAVSPGIAEPEHRGAMAHKIGQGFPIIEIPARLMLPWPAARYLRATKPNAYYRLTGVPPPGWSPEVAR